MASEEKVGPLVKELAARMLIVKVTVHRAPVNEPWVATLRQEIDGMSDDLGRLALILSYTDLWDDGDV